ncbi:DUF4236 domain-containing protein [Dactylosporangium sp. CA-139114]|uniref:DUF4236 domain-containing protein n=1 Tax=Dactylosporangium sp. CA-139114 TaxID=3239931 RepID=UPI003D97C238
MGLRIRTSLRAGPFRMSLSPRGMSVSAGVPGFRVGAGPRGNYVSVGAAGIRYRATIGGGPSRARVAGAPGPAPVGPAPATGVVLHDTTGHDAVALQPTGPGDLVEQLNRAEGRPLLWPWLAVALFLTFVSTVVVPPVALVVLVGGPFVVVWYRLWERARRTVVTFYEVDGPAAFWFEHIAQGFDGLRGLGGAWRIRESGAITDAYQRKVNAGAGNLVGRADARFSLTSPRALTTNIDVPTLTCGQDALLFLPDRVLVRAGRRWSDVAYHQLHVAPATTRFIESGRVPRDGRQVDTTWQYVNAKGGPDRRFKDNRQLPVMVYGRLELRSPGGLRWIVDCSRTDAAEWLARALRPPAPVERTVAARIARVAPTPLAAPGHQGRLFAYADLLARAPGLRPHTGPYAIVDVETTGLAPEAGDRIIEIAIARVDRTGRIEDEFVTLVNPDGRDTGPVLVHGIDQDAVRDAPRFADIAGEVVRRLDGCVLVAHNAAFEERFLAAELARAGLRVGPVPALCTLWLARRSMPTPNHKLATLARHAGIAMPDAHAALGDVRAVAALLPVLLGRAGGELGYACPPLTAAALRLPPAVAFRPRTRAVGLRRGTDGWMASILARLPMSAAEAGGAEAERYLDHLAIALADGRIVGDEAQALARLAGSAGFGSAQVAALNERFLESMREAAFADGVLTAAELRQLEAAARALGVADYFDDLRAQAVRQPAPALAPTQTPIPAPVPAPVPAPAQAGPGRRRCGHCRTPGHYRNTCPELLGAV